MQITNLAGQDESGLGLLQYWYTQAVVMDGPQGPGVYMQEVWAPKLVGRFAAGFPCQGQILTEPPGPPDTSVPEPGTWGMVILALVIYGLCYAGLRAMVGWLYRDRGDKKP